MSTTYPIKDEKQLEKFESYFLEVKPIYRNYAIIVMGLNTAFRIGDLLSLRWEDVYNEKTGCFKKHIRLKEHKTNKERCVAVNSVVHKVLTTLQAEYNYQDGAQCLFPGSKNATTPLSRTQAFRIVKEAAEYAGFEEHISCHSLRKTFGYQAWKQGVPPAVIMDIFNHSSYRITKRYLCIEQDDRDKVYLEVCL
ncbi:MAG: tyrosine-type recombinase/integrase [Clostridiales bacterium]|nr:tyrosine-type recombinase/integrase [Clostridiales bacterium]